MPDEQERVFPHVRPRTFDAGTRLHNLSDRLQIFRLALSPDNDFLQLQMLAKGIPMQTCCVGRIVKLNEHARFLMEATSNCCWAPPPTHRNRPSAAAVRTLEVRAWLNFEKN